MPFVQKWVPAPKDESLPVLAELPPGQQRVREPFWGECKTAYVNGQPYYYCSSCQGWIQGLANEFSVNTLDSRSLSGRRGREYCCRRCGEEIGFIGMRS